MTIGTTAVKVADRGDTVILQNRGPGKLAFGYGQTPDPAAGGTGLVLEVGATSERFVASGDVYAKADAASTDLRVERL